MNLHYQMFHKLLPIIERTSTYIESNGGADLTFSEELCYMIMSACHFRLGNQMDKLLYADEFCIFCIYANLNNVRKSTSKYLALEKEVSMEASILLKDIYDTTNDLCVLINNNYDRKDEEHRIIENLALECITLTDLQRVRNTHLEENNDLDDNQDDEKI